MTSNIIEKRQRATEYRRNKDIGNALPLYQELWLETNNLIDGTGLLHCERKLGKLDEAIRLADTIADRLILEHPNYLEIRDYEWTRIEIIWTYIQGILLKFDDNNHLDEVVRVADKIMKFNPDDIAKKIVVLKVLKIANTDKNWNIIQEWSDKIDPSSLSQTPIMFKTGKEGWSDQALWYNYKINGLVETEPEKALIIIDQIVGKYPKQDKFFIRLKGRAYYKTGNTTESETCYKFLCDQPKVDWWLLHEYGLVLKDIGKTDEALKILCRAAKSNPKLQLLVTLFYDIGILFYEQKQFDDSRNHLLLSKFVRAENNWSISYLLNSKIDELNIICKSSGPETLKDALYSCKKTWDVYTRESEKIETCKSSGIRRNLTGRVKIFDDKPFGFINTNDGEGFFFYKSDLTNNIQNGCTVKFDAVPSFDKKKGVQSWKAIKISTIT